MADDADRSGTPDALPLGGPVAAPAPLPASPVGIPGSESAIVDRAMAGLHRLPRLARTGAALLRRLAPRLPRLALRAALTFALGSAVVIGALRWVNPPASAFMVLHAANGWRLGREPPYYYHRWVPWESIPPALPLAVIASEDQRFPLHHGFDPVELRKALKTWRAGGSLRGASTITQQTAKNLFLWPGRNWLRKGLEAWFTALIEILWSKQRILEVYLNIVQFSPSTYGVGAASERYFERPVGELTLHEAALLAGVLPSPGAYRLDRPSARLRRRAQWIVDQAGRLGGRRYLERL